MWRLSIAVVPPPEEDAEMCAAVYGPPGWLLGCNLCSRANANKQMSFSFAISELLPRPILFLFH